ncbi:2-oxoacid:acceptor oxidoreductase family protein [Mesosutterella sp. OilRF-GAM-744-9]|uniref:2-oxoacid:acceptor oxidoreductase family protein n=1 Tax=Mesosutterella porci TaxID=2915351 RepID=A0ABS9MS56_9BURK|nr:2-oxoacid:acceptor oxidoreductase family protein [Mesosutterella sp. oilRF-744-WT-GAM-9]MCG5031159.1 2-oxoacid:acceptor oxidoreductase family protein [Mesosutterella sp. oilRF-744-WT-GAM-9]MCI6530365.1 2-oxoacid:acceptor oxidoreductase family protein [Mesosutterella sp.]
MFQVRLHGRGGQGVVTAAEMLSLAAFMEGHFAQAFPSFGSERTGAPVVAFARISDHSIRLHEPIEEPDAVLIQDRTLIETVDVFGGLSRSGFVLVNSAAAPEEIGLGELVSKLPKGHVRTVPATDLALKYIGRPLPGAAMLAGFAAMTGLLKLESINAAYGQKYSGKVAQANANVAAGAWSHMLSLKDGD